MARILIQGVTPEVYAGYWGETTTDGVYFYNFSSENVQKTPERLDRFAKIIEKQIASVEADPDNYLPDDADDLRTLLNYVKAKRASL